MSASSGMTPARGGTRPPAALAAELPATGTLMASEVSGLRQRGLGIGVQPRTQFTAGHFCLLSHLIGGIAGLANGPVEHRGRDREKDRLRHALSVSEEAVWSKVFPRGAGFSANSGLLWSSSQCAVARLTVSTPLSSIPPHDHRSTQVTLIIQGHPVQTISCAGKASARTPGVAGHVFDDGSSASSNSRAARWMRLATTSP